MKIPAKILSPCPVRGFEAEKENKLLLSSFVDGGTLQFAKYVSRQISKRAQFDNVTCHFFSQVFFRQKVRQSAKKKFEEGKS